VEAIQPRLGFDRVERDERSGQHDEIAWAVTEDLVSDVHVAHRG
jgi:hypothetical protein